MTTPNPSGAPDGHEIRPVSSVKLDALTGCTTRLTFLSEGEELFNLTINNDEPVALVLFDVDHFKEVQTEFGQDNGNQVLSQLVKKCAKHRRSNDVFARINNDTFALLLTNTTEFVAECIAQTIRKDVETQSFITNDLNMIDITVSAGVASSQDETIQTFITLLNQANSALYLAKSTGRNQVKMAIGL